VVAFCFCLQVLHYGYASGRNDEFIEIAADT